MVAQVPMTTALVESTMHRLFPPSFTISRRTVPVVTIMLRLHPRNTPVSCCLATTICAAAREATFTRAMIVNGSVRSKLKAAMSPIWMMSLVPLNVRAISILPADYDFPLSAESAHADLPALSEAFRNRPLSALCASSPHIVPPIGWRLRAHIDYRLPRHDLLGLARGDY